MKKIILIFSCIVIASLAVPTIALAQSVDTFQNEVTVEAEAAAPDVPKKQDTISFRTVPDSVISKLQNSEDFAYANDPEYWKKEEPPRLTFPPFLRYVIWGLIIAFALYILIRIAKANNLFSFRKAKSINPVISELDSDLLDREDLSSLIKEAETNQNFRLATRYRYMKTLQDLDRKQLITLDKKRTNWDYVKQLSLHTLHKKFLYLTQSYEYVWYGEFDINSLQYDFLKSKFEQLT